MKRLSILLRLFAVFCAGLVVTMVSVRDVHYLFVEHVQAHDNCHNHLHAADSDFHCKICKADISSFTDVVFRQKPGLPAFFVEVHLPFSSILTIRELAFDRLSRGPPEMV